MFDSRKIEEKFRLEVHDKVREEEINVTCKEN